MVAARVDQMCKTVSIFPSFICCLSISTWGKLSSVLTNDHFAIQTERRNLFKILYRFTDSLKISICVKVTLKEKKIKLIHRFAWQIWLCQRRLFVCLWKERNEKPMLPKPTVHEAMRVGKNSCESQWVSVGSGKRWVIMEMSKSDEENKIWSQSDYCIFHYVGGSIQGKWSIGRVEGA